MLRLRASAFVVGLLGACGGQLNPSVPTPKSGELGEQPGVWVAYNLGCTQGCDKIRRGDIIIAIDGKPVTSGAEVDAAGLADGTPAQLDVRSRAHGPIRVTLRATPNAYMRPIERAPPLWTVGTAALDRAPEWARLKAFGHATPALRFYRLDDPRGFRNGRELYGRHTLIVYWTPDNSKLQNQRRNMALLPVVYAHLQAREAELRAAGVDTIFLLRGRATPLQRGYIRSQIQLDSYGWAPNMIPLLSNETNTRNPNTLGIEHPAADLNELLFNDGHVGPILLVLDARGVVRWHSRGWHREDVFLSLDTVIDFAIRDLGDTPPALTPLEPAPQVEPAEHVEPAPVSAPTSAPEPAE